MSKLRSVNTAFWSDPLIEELNPKEKLLFLYLITNEKTNMLGIYESSIKKMSFETGLSNTEVESILKRLEGLGRVKHMGNWVLLVNYMKHQNYNTNMKISALNTYKSLPKELKVNKIDYDIKNPSEGFETLLKCLGTVSKYEIEYEVESELETETEKDLSSKPDVGILVDKYLVWFNKLFDRKFRSDTYTKLCTSKFKVLLKKYGNNVEAFSQDLLKVGNTVKLDTYHIETNYKHVTPEFILRPDKFEKFLNVSFLEDKNKILKWKTPSDIFMCMDWIKRIPKPPDYETQTSAYEMFMYEWRISELMTYQYDRCGAHSNLSEYED